MHSQTLKKPQGEPVVVSDLMSAIEGMLLKPVIDTIMTAALLNEAQGKSSIK